MVVAKTQLRNRNLPNTRIRRELNVGNLLHNLPFFLAVSYYTFSVKVLQVPVSLESLTGFLVYIKMSTAAQENIDKRGLKLELQIAVVEQPKTVQSLLAVMSLPFQTMTGVKMLSSLTLNEQTRLLLFHVTLNIKEIKHLVTTTSLNINKM
jgi:hypothetical protein